MEADSAFHADWEGPYGGAWRVRDQGPGRGPARRVAAWRRTSDLQGRKLGADLRGRAARLAAMTVNH
jgi:hypothetical protein